MINELSQIIISDHGLNNIHHTRHTGAHFQRSIRSAHICFQMTRTYTDHMDIVWFEVNRQTFGDHIERCFTRTVGIDGIALPVLKAYGSHSG